MAETEPVYARIEKSLKDNAEGILAQLGITPSSAIQMFYSQIVLKGGLPFEAVLPRRQRGAGKMIIQRDLRFIGVLKTKPVYSETPDKSMKQATAIFTDVCTKTTRREYKYFDAIKVIAYKSNAESLRDMKVGDFGWFVGWLKENEEDGSFSFQVKDMFYSEEETFTSISPEDLLTSMDEEEDLDEQRKIAEELGFTLEEFLEPNFPHHDK